MIVSRSKIDRIKGALYGAAIGDAMGATTEFLTPTEIGALHGEVKDIIGGGQFGWQPGEVTDDTQMSFCIMRAVQAAESGGAIDKEKFEAKVAEEFIQWYRSGPKDVGNACAKGIRALIDGKVCDSSQAFGNGGLMRALPLALIGELELNVIQNNLTHNNPQCHKAIWIHHRVIQYYLEHGSLYMGPDDISYSTPMEPTGHVINTLNNALYYTYVSCTMADAILWPVNAGGDADTIACIAGGLAGTKWGMDEIPVRWVRQLLPEVRERLDQYLDWSRGYLERKAARMAV